MKILAWDIGIKNLSYCLYDTQCDNIIDWNVIDISQNGKEIFNKQYTLETSRTVQLDVSDLPKGSFIVKAKGNTIHTSELLIKE